MPQGKAAETALSLVQVVAGQASGFGEQVIEPAVAVLWPAERQAQLRALTAVARVAVLVEGEARLFDRVGQAADEIYHACSPVVVMVFPQVRYVRRMAEWSSCSKPEVTPRTVLRLGGTQTAIKPASKQIWTPAP
jgi:hypothetical protein